MNLYPLSELYAAQGVALRKHTGTYPIWTDRATTVIALTLAERRLLRRAGDAALDADLRARGQFPFPSLSLASRPVARRRTVLAAADRPCLAICAPPAGHYRRLAQALADWLRAAGGVPPRMVNDADFNCRLPGRVNLALLGGAHENRAAAALAGECRLDADAALPGPRGLLIRTLHNPGNRGYNVLQICCGAARGDEALRILRRQAVADGAGVALPEPVWQVRCDPGSFPGLRFKPRVLAELERQRPYRNPRARPPRTVAQLAARAAADFDSGGKAADRYNVYPLILANTAADIFSRTGDPDYLKLFLAMLRAMLDYFTQTPGGASMPSDIEFYAGRVIANWELLAEHLPVTPAERLIFDNLLLAVTEMCAGYKAARWPTVPGALRHNHETFGALTLFFGGRYFHDHYRWPAARGWQQVARECFNSPQMEKNFKYKENANMYQWLVPAHKLIYDRATGRRAYTDNGRLALVARNIVITTDNFGYPCDFGDAGAPISGGSLGAALLDAAAMRYADPGLAWTAAHIRAAQPRPLARDLLPPTAWLPGCRRPVGAGKAPALPALSVMPLDGHIRRQYGGAAFPAGKAYDKLALRAGWFPDAQYLLLEGYSYPAGGHAHRDQNSIIRLNHLGRVWLVDNSYGKPDRKQGAADAYRFRQTGPEDHNTVQFVQNDGKFAAYPNLCVLEISRDYGPLALVRSALPGMAGGDWRRTVLWVKGRFFLVVDDVRVGRSDLAAVRCQWNMLGRLDLPAAGLGVCTQGDRRLFIHFDAAPAIQRGTYCNLNWRMELVPEVYPHARAPIQKMNQVYANPLPGNRLLFANLFYAARGRRPLLAMERAGPASWKLSGAGLRELPLPRGAFLRRLPGRDAGVIFTAE